MTLDHIVPLAMNGEDDVRNLQCTCESCNLFKGSVLPEDFMDRINEIFWYQMEKKNHRNLLWILVKKSVKKIDFWIAKAVKKLKKYVILYIVDYIYIDSVLYGFLYIEKERAKCWH